MDSVDFEKDHYVIIVIFKFNFGKSYLVNFIYSCNGK